MSRVFRHVVFFRFNERVTPEIIEQIQASLPACAMALPGTRAYACGPDVQCPADDKSRYDFSLVADFVDEAAWKAYDLDAEHNRLRAELIGPVMDHRVMVQYWVDQP